MPFQTVHESDKRGLRNVSGVDPRVEDAALVVAAQSGNGHALEILVERHERQTFSMAQRITRNREDAEDVVQRSFQKAFINLQKFEGRSLLPTPFHCGAPT
jgi:RNA polymerase sigma-70 factor (ECF subfamily)